MTQIEPSPLNSTESGEDVGVINTADVVEHCEAIRPWDLIIRQVSLGAYRSQTEYVSLGSVLIYREHCARGLSVVGATPSGYLCLGAAADAATRIEWCGRELKPDQLAFGAGSQEVDVFLPVDSRHVVLLVREDLVLEHLGQTLGPRLLASGSRHLRPHPGAGESFVRIVHCLIDRFLEHPDELAEPGVRRSVEHQLMDVVYQAVDSAGPSTEGESLHRRRLGLQRALAFASDLRHPVSVEKLAAAAGVGRRTLELAFRESLQLSPLQYLTRFRMNGAHRDLRAATPDSAQIKGIAAKWGFSEAGRFAVDYRRLFGESPSQSLRCRCRQPAIRLEDVLLR